MKQRLSVASISDHYYDNENYNRNNNYPNNVTSIPNANSDIQKFKNNFKAMQSSSYSAHQQPKYDEEEDDEEAPQNLITMRNSRNKIEMRNNYNDNFDRLSSSRDKKTSTRPW